MKQLIKQIYFILLRQWVRYKFARLSKRLSCENIKGVITTSQFVGKLDGPHISA